jgi:hypothetical protein
MRSYKEAMMSGTIDDFMQELMLRITSEENQLIDVSRIPWFSRSDLLRNKDAYNWYIVTDLAVSKASTADLAVIIVIAVDAKGNHFIVDGQAKRGDPSDHINDVFDYAQKYNPLSVGIEISGQQAAFVSMLRDKMIRENRFFHIHEQVPGKPGIRTPVGKNKYTNFLGILHLFSNQKLWLPKELRETFFIQEMLQELKGVTKTNTGKRIGVSKHDDVIDALAQIQHLNVVLPSEQQTTQHKNSDGIWAIEEIEPEEEYYNPYIF